MYNWSNYISEEHLIPRAKIRELDAALFIFVCNLHQATHFYHTIESHTGGEQERAEGPIRSNCILNTYANVRTYQVQSDFKL